MHVQVDEVKDNYETWETPREKNEWRKKEEKKLCKQVGCFSWMMTKKRHRVKNKDDKERRTSFSLITSKGC
jgi:hypothetical protein